jgi:formylglycine-generating enzyme required for sulfatase activity
MRRVCSLLVIVLGIIVFPAVARADATISPVTITNSIGMKLTLIPSGEFTMGSNESNYDLKKAFGETAFKLQLDDSKLIDELASNDFEKRERACRLLADRVQEIRPQLEAALKASNDLEQRTRLKRILSNPVDPPGAPMAVEDGKQLVADFSDESPPHKVRITKPFYMGTYHVTLFEFMNFCHESKYTCDCQRDAKGGFGYDPKSKGKEKFNRGVNFTPWSWGFKGQTTEHPVVDVSWNDAVAFCQWLSKKEGKRYRLPTEAEWEYACRAGTTTRFYNGDNPRGVVLVGNVADASAKKAFGWTETIDALDGYAFTAPVGHFKPNAFGLYDMHGNAFQWCSDYYSGNYYGKSPIDDPQGPATGSSRVARGGSWRSNPLYCRASYRAAYQPDFFRLRYGFRVVCER